MKARLVALALLVAALAAPSAHAAPWARVTTPDGASTDQVGLARTADGVLHLAWHHPTGPNTVDLLHTVISPAGKVGATTPIQSGGPGSPTPRSSSTPAASGRSGAASARRTPAIRSARPTPRSRRRRRDLGAAARLGRAARRAVLREQHRGDRARRRVDAAGVRRDARHVGARGPLARHAEPRLPGAARQVRLRPEPRDRRGRPDACSPGTRARRAPRRAGAGRGRGRLAGRRAANMPGTGDMQIGMLGRTPVAARPGGGLYVAYPTATRPRSACGCGGSGRAARRADRRLPGSNSPAVAVAAAATGGCGSLDKGLRRPRRARATLQQGRDAVRRDRERRASEGRRTGVQARRERGRRRARPARQLQHRHTARPR